MIAVLYALCAALAAGILSLVFLCQLRVERRPSLALAPGDNPLPIGRWEDA